MDIILEKTGNGLDTTISINIEKTDYESDIKKALNKIQKKVSIPGFRVGQAPMGLVNRHYAKSVKMEEIEKLMQKSLADYIEDNKIDYLLQPLSQFKYDNINWNGDTFKFDFSLGLKPHFELDFDALNQLSRPMMNIQEDDVEEEITRIRQQFAEREFLDSWDGSDNKTISIRIEELDQEGKKMEGGKSGYKIYTSQDIPESLKTLINGLQKTIPVPVNPRDIFEEEELKSMLKLSSGELETLNLAFQLTVDSVMSQNLPDLTPEFFEKIGLQNTDEEGFREKQKEELSQYMEKNSDNYFQRKMRDHLVAHTLIELPETFLEEYFEQAYDKTKVKDEEDKLKSIKAFKDDMKWMLITDQILENNGLEVTETDIQSVAFETVYRMFIQAGYYQAGYDQISNYTSQWLKNDNNKSEAIFKAKSNVVYGYLTEVVNPKEEIMTIKEFNALV